MWLWAWHPFPTINIIEKQAWLFWACASEPLIKAMAKPVAVVAGEKDFLIRWFGLKAIPPKTKSAFIGKRRRQGWWLFNSPEPIE